MPRHELGVNPHGNTVPMTKTVFPRIDKELNIHSKNTDSLENCYCILCEPNRGAMAPHRLEDEFTHNRRI